MKKTIFSGLLVITLLVFASCVPLPEDFGDDGSGEDDTNNNLQDVVNSDFEGTWEFTFYFQTRGAVDTFTDNLNKLEITLGVVDGSLDIIDTTSNESGDEYLLIDNTEYTYVLLINNELRISLDLTYEDENLATTDIFLKMIATDYTLDSGNNITKIEGNYDESVSTEFVTDDIGGKHYFTTWKLDRVN